MQFKSGDHDSDNLSMGKRKSIKSALGFAVVSGVWTSPVIKSVVIPVHANTSGVEESAGDDTEEGAGDDLGGDTGEEVVRRTFFGSPGVGVSESQGASLSGFGAAAYAVLSTIVPEAQAQPSTTALCIEQTGDMFSVTLEGVFPSPDFTVINHYVGQGKIGDAIPLDGSCFGQTPFEIQLSEPTGSAIGFVFTQGSRQSGSIPEASCGLMDVMCPLSM